MDEKRIRIQNSFSSIYRAIIFVFLLLTVIFALCLFYNFEFYVSGDGEIVTSVEAPIKSKKNGTILKFLVKDGSTVSCNQEIICLKDDSGKIFTINTPISGQFIRLSDEDVSAGRTIRANQIVAIVLDEGKYFRSKVSEKDVLDIKEGQNCFVRLWALDRKESKPLEGKVLYVSDLPSYELKKTYYSVFCFLDEDGPVGEVKLGMGGQAKIAVGKNSLFDYILGFKKRE